MWGIPNTSGFVSYRPCDQPNTPITLPLNNNQPFQSFCTEYPLQGEKFEIVEIGDICDIKSGKAINSDNHNGTKYPYYAANGISKYVDEYLFDGKFIICAQDGNVGATHLVNCKFYASNHVWVLKIENINPYYVVSRKYR